jgi:RNA polymerase sigma-70 factor (ECF subfamily)
MDAAPERHFSTAVDAVVTRFGGMVRQVGRRHRLGEAELDEVLQDVRIRLWRSQQSGEQVEHVSASYVYRTAMSAAVDLLRRRRSRRADSTVPIEAHGDRLPDGPAASPDADLAVSELARQVARAIETISAARRPVVRMYLAGYPREEIADLLGWSEAKTRNLLYRGLADLRTRLTEQGIGLEWKEKTA